QKELAAFLEKQQAEARLHSSIHNFTGICWDKQVISGSLSTELIPVAANSSNCVERFLDTSLFMVRGTHLSFSVYP
ncbi:hypothetical protein C8R44DRAFT_605121, partial [Mycena epipterygia]